MQALGVAGAVDALVVVAHDRDASGERSAGRSSSTPACGVGLHDRHLLVGQAAGLVEDLGRHGELADVVDQQPEAELAHALVEAVVAAAAAVVGPAVGAPGAAGDQQAEHGDLDAVAVRVVVERGEVVQRERGVGAVEQVVDHRAGDVGERLDDRARHPGAGAQRGAGGRERDAGRACGPWRASRASAARRRRSSRRGRPRSRPSRRRPWAAAPRSARTASRRRAAAARCRAGPRRRRGPVPRRRGSCVRGSDARTVSAESARQLDRPGIVLTASTVRHYALPADRPASLASPWPQRTR